jgi:hypothetical protein
MKVEIHTALRFVDVRGDRTSAGAEAIRGAGLCEPLAGLPGDCRAPVEDLLAAHALAHGIAQHGVSPGAYPLMRMVADLVDLGLDAAAVDRFLPGPYRWISRVVAESELRAAFSLAGALAAGDQRLFGEAESLAGARTMLRHVVAGAIDDTYRRSLRFGGFWTTPSDKPFVHRLYRSVVLTRGQVDVIYGPPTSRWGYLGRRLWRPFDLIVRLVRHGWCHLGFRRRAREGVLPDRTAR